MTRTVMPGGFKGGQSVKPLSGQLPGSHLTMERKFRKVPVQNLVGIGGEPLSKYGLVDAAKIGTKSQVPINQFT